MTIVVDASVALKWVLDEPGSEAAQSLRNEELIAPSLWLVEAANVLWLRARRGHISTTEARERLTELFNAPVSSGAIEVDLEIAADLAVTLGHPVYDCLYLAMAIRENTYVVTADARFHAAVGRSPTLKNAVRMLGS